MEFLRFDRLPVDDEPLLGLEEEEEKFICDTVAKVVAYILAHPLVTAKVLMRLGHELDYGRTLTRTESFLLPFTYGRQLAKQHGWKVLWTGVDAAALTVIVETYVARWMKRYLDVHFPEMGGAAEHDGFRRKLRIGIRESVGRVVAVTVARPLSVICIRQIAQLIGGEAKYLNVGQAIGVILEEEGWGGMLSGLIPHLFGELIMLWGCHVVTFAAERALKGVNIHDENKANALEIIEEAAPIIVMPLCYPYRVVSTVMACVGSGLAASLFLPYHRTFNNWLDCYDYLRPYGIMRGANYLFREQSMAFPGIGRLPVDGEPFVGLDAEEEKFLLETVVNVAGALLKHPLHTAKTLMRLGHEPCPFLQQGKTFVVRGREAFYLPDAFTYAKFLADEHGWRVLLTGFDAAALTIVVERYVARWTNRYLDIHIPEMGGAPEHEGEDERNLTIGQSFRRKLRGGIRESTARTVAVIVARPFTVICIRQIGQLIGGETKYLNVGQGFRLILTEEGWGGLLAGLIPQLIAELIMLWSCQVVTFAAERALARTNLCKHRREDVMDIVDEVAPYVVRPFSYKYTVVSTVMACVGSGLAFSLFLPYHRTFDNWLDCYDYLGPQGLKRGANHLFRETTPEAFFMTRLRRKMIQVVV